MKQIREIEQQMSAKKQIREIKTDQADQIEILERHIDPRPDLKGDNLAWGIYCKIA